MKFYRLVIHGSLTPSPPSRAAWIEIAWGKLIDEWILSPPSRAAWIEISYPIKVNFVAVVAAFTGGVD